MLRTLMLIAVMATTLTTGCSEPADPPAKNTYVGDLSDHSYAGQITPAGKKYRINGEGERIAIDRHAGKFVWADLAAPWCPPCVPQTQAISALESIYGDRVVFMTIITSDEAGTLQPPHPRSASEWARRFRLDPANVVVATDLFGRKVPAHFFYSPTGQTLFHHIGGLSEAQIRTVLNQHLSTWQDTQ